MVAIKLNCGLRLKAEGESFVGGPLAAVTLIPQSVKSLPVK